jgi:membrane protein implicated in regulation of membrane protease activity
VKALALEPASVRVWVLGSVWVQALVWALLRWALAWVLVLVLVLVWVLVRERERERELQQKEQALAREQAWAQATELVLEPRRPAPRCNSRSASRCHHGRHWR